MFHWHYNGSICKAYPIKHTIDLFCFDYFVCMMTSWHGNAFHIADPLWGESTSDKLWCFLWSLLEQSVIQTVELLVIPDIMAHMISLWWYRWRVHCGFTWYISAPCSNGRGAIIYDCPSEWASLIGLNGDDLQCHQWWWIWHYDNSFFCHCTNDGLKLIKYITYNDHQTKFSMIMFSHQFWSIQLISP